MKNKKKILLAMLLVFLLGAFFIFPTVQAANGVTIPTDTGLSSKTIAEILTTFLKWLLTIVGIIAVIGFVISGIQYIVASGNDKVIESAKKNMMYSLIGITVALASYIIVKAIDSILKATIGT